MLRLRVGEDREMFKSYRTGRVLAATWKTLPARNADRTFFDIQ
jgi:hypothetical protein